MNVAPQAEEIRGANCDTQVHRAILVLGMHRSGTSAATRCLNLLGVDVGRDLLPAENDNPKGFWEHAEVVRIHQELLTALDRNWSDARALPEGWLATGAAHSARDALGRLVRNDFGRSALWAIKDPRLCRLVPLWREVLVEQAIKASALLVVRHPFEVARSLHIRDGIPLETAYLGWLEHFAEAEIETRSMPRSLVLYEDLLSDWRRVFSRIGRDLGVEWPRSFDEAQSDIDAYLDKGQRHHDASGNSGAVPELLQRLYALCQSCQVDPNGWGGISRMVDDYRLMAPTFLGRDERLVDELRRSERRIQRANGIVLDGFHRLASEARAIQKTMPVTEDHATLYFRSASEEFSEERSQSRSHVWDESKVVFHFELPAGKQPTGLRFDPSRRAGAFRVDELRIDGTPVRDLPGRVRHVNQLNLEQQATSGVWFVSFDEDPHVEFDLGDLATQNNNSIDIEIDCRRFDLERVATSSMIWMLGGLRRELEAHADNLVVELSRQSVTAEALRVRNRQLEAELAAAGQRLEAELAEAGARERTSQQEVSQLMKSMTGLRNELEFARTLNADLQANNAIWRTAQKQAHAAAAAVVGELAAIEASTLWRLLVRLRALGLRFSPRSRRLLRRALKTAWWIITPWRIPERVRFLKARAVGEHAGRTVGQPLMVPGTEPVSRPGYIYADPSADSEKISSTLRNLSLRTLFSVIVPVYNTEPELLKRTIASVESQWHPDWELILVDDHSSTPQVRQVLDDLADQRITVIRLDKNKGISGATNEGIARARGDFIVFLDHDDELTVDCLFELAVCIDRDNPDYLYSDEDKLEVDGSFRDAFFKPDWSPDTIMSTMYTCHVSCVRRSLALEVGGLRSEYDGSQDWDFVLRVTERTSRISHIPKVLYHWRIIPQSCAADLQAKPYAIDASRRAREDALRRRGQPGDLVPVPGLPGYFRTRYHLKSEPLFSIIIPSKNNGAVLKNCIDSIFEKTAYRRFEVLVINNGSTDAATLDYLATLRAGEHVLVLDHDVPFNYSEINNFGVGYAKGEFFVFLNDDTEILSEHWLDHMGGYAQLPHVGAVGAKLLYPGRRTIQHVGVVNLRCGPSHAFVNMGESDPGYFYRNLLEYDWLAVTGACMMMERSKFEMLGGFDQDLAVAYNDMDLCFRSYEKGWSQVVCPGVMLLHYESLSRGNDTRDAKKLARLDRERELLFRKHPDLLGRDPFHNPNFDPDDPYFGMRVAPHNFTSFAASDHVLQLQSGGVQCSLDTVDGKPAVDLVAVPRGSTVTLTGWAGDGSGQAVGQFAIVLKDRSRTYCASAMTGVPRPDVADAMGCGGMVTSGYRLTASLADVEPGIYSLYAVKPGDSNVATGLTTRLLISQ